ncbi:MAG: ferrous iron transport protein B [Lachnospiraceae bacterium]
MSEKTIALLGQPNSGKTTLFNILTGSRQHVGNWPGKTVEQKEGYFTNKDINYKVVDLPGSYSLSANSEEEIITRDYIVSGKADLVCILVDASQLERSLYMVADYVGLKSPAILLLNMMDVATEQGKKVDHLLMQKKLGIPVIPFVAADRKKYDQFFDVLAQDTTYHSFLDEIELDQIYQDTVGTSYIDLLSLLPAEGIEKYSAAWLAVKTLENDSPALKLVHSVIKSTNQAKLDAITNNSAKGNLLSAEAKFKWIEQLLKESVVNTKKDGVYRQSKFDRLATSKKCGKPIAVGIVVLGLIGALLIATPFMTLFSYIPIVISPLVEKCLTALGAPNFLISLICEALLTAVYFATSMTSFVLGISLVFGFIEEIGYMARISYVFDNTMSKLGLQGKAIMPFLVSFGCNIGGMSGTRVIDSWGQRVLTMAMAWVVPCAATWGVVSLIATTFFGSGGAIVIIIILILTAVLHVIITAKIFGRKLIKEEDKTGLIMELPPYHKPKYKNLFHFVMNRCGDVLFRALKMVLLVAAVFWALSYTSDGDITRSIVYRVGTFIEPVTMWFGLRWQMFMAFIASGMGKEASLGVLSSLFDMTNVGIWSAFAGNANVDSTVLSGTLLGTITKPEALAFLFAFFFNIPCLMTTAATAQECHSYKWTIRIVIYYIIAALIMAAIAYHVGLLIF